MGGSGWGKGSHWSDNLPRHVRISKSLTQILRHKAVDLGVDIRADGYCRLERVLALPWMTELSCTAADVDKVVRESDKKRFELRRRMVSNSSARSKVTRSRPLKTNTCSASSSTEIMTFL